MKPSRQIKNEIAKKCTHANTYILAERIDSKGRKFTINASNESANFVSWMENGKEIHCCWDCYEKAKAAEKAAKKLDPKVKREKRPTIITADYMAFAAFSGGLLRQRR